MNLYLLVSRPAPSGEAGAEVPPWTLSASVFETMDEATAWAERNLVGQTWRLVMVPSVSITQ
jgi:hypothetical protein